MTTETSRTPPATGPEEAPRLPRGFRAVTSISALAPYNLFGAPASRFVVERNLLIWRGQIPALLSGLFEPLLYLLVLGVGVGGLVDPGAIGGGTYGEFVAAGLLGAASMNATVYETYNVYFKLRHDRLYDAIGATPAGPRDIAVGETIWGSSRVLIYAVGFLVVAFSLGLVRTPMALLAIPIAVLVGFAFGTATLAATTYMRSWHDFDLLQIVIVPMFLFSATFYPLDVLPGWAQVVTVCSPLYHGIAALRQVMLGQVDGWIVVHLVVLVVVAVAGFRVGARRFEVLLRT